MIYRVWSPWWGLFSLGWLGLNVITIVRIGSIPIVLNFPVVQIPRGGIFSIGWLFHKCLSVFSLMTLDLSPPLRLSSSLSLKEYMLDSSPDFSSANRDLESIKCMFRVQNFVINRKGVLLPLFFYSFHPTALANSIMGECNLPRTLTPWSSILKLLLNLLTRRSISSLSGPSKMVSSVYTMNTVFP